MQSRKIFINAAGIALFLVAGAISMYFMPSDNTAPAKNVTPAPEPATQAVAPSPAQEPATWYVHISGAVKSPGVYQLPANSRIFQAVDLAGGLTSRADHTAINLAEPLHDSAHIHIPEIVRNSQPKAQTSTPAPAQAPAAKQTLYIEGTTGKKSSSKASTGSVKVDINNATAKELEQLNGIGPAIAKRIVDYRNSNGRFNTPEDLINVKGIGAAKLEKMRSQILIR